MAVNTYVNKVLFTGTQAAYDAATKSEAGLYFTTDTHKLYKGAVDFSAAVRVVSALPASGAANNVIYVVMTEGAFVSASFTTDGGTTWTALAIKTVTSINAGAASDAAVPTEKAVVDYVDSVVGGGNVVTDVSASTSQAATVVETVGTGAEATATNVEIPGVVTKPTWNASTRVLSIPYTAVGSTAAGTVEVNIGKDLVLESGRYDSATQKIILVLNDDAHTEIEIDVAALIDEIHVDNTDTVNMSYNTTTNTITSDVRVSGKTGNALQALTGQAVDGENGLYISLADYATTADLADLEARVDDNETNIEAVYDSISTWVTLS
jgi:hypothetical protein